MYKNGKTSKIGKGQKSPWIFKGFFGEMGHLDAPFGVVESELRPARATLLSFVCVLFVFLYCCQNWNSIDYFSVEIVLSLIALGSHLLIIYC